LAGYMLQQRIDGHEIGVWLTACQSHQRAKCNITKTYESGGAFTHCLINSIWQHGGLITNGELIEDVSEQFSRYLCGYDASTLQLYSLLDYQQPGLYGSQRQSDRLFFGVPPL
jgi:hypothetical protein